MNKFTRTVKETVLEAFNELQSDPLHNIVAFARDNPKEFYQIAAKLIPTEVTANVTQMPAPIIHVAPMETPESRLNVASEGT